MKVEYIRQLIDIANKRHESYRPGNNNLTLAELDEMFNNHSKPTQLLASIFLPENDNVFVSIHDEHGNSNIHYHDFFEINYVIEGHPKGYIDQHQIDFRPGNLLLMNPNAIHHYSKYKDNEDIILNIVLPVETFRKAIYRALLSDSRLNAFFIRYKVENHSTSSFILLDTIGEDAEAIIELLVKEYLSKKSYSNLIIESLITLLFSYILRSYNELPEDKDKPINKVLNYIYVHYNICNIEDIAQDFGYHPKYLSTLIKKHTGQSYRQLLTTIKLQNSLQYLTYSNHSIETIVELIGYKDKSSFYQSFKKQFNMSPGEYRESHKA